MKVGDIIRIKSLTSLSFGGERPNISIIVRKHMFDLEMKSIMLTGIENFFIIDSYSFSTSSNRIGYFDSYFKIIGDSTSAVWVPKFELDERFEVLEISLKKGKQK